MIQLRTHLILVSLLLLSVVGCRYNASSDSVDKKLPEMVQPMRVSSEEANASEPAIASSPDGDVYVAWVNHYQNNQADVMVARFTGKGQMQTTPVRVNARPGIATAWRGDPPTITVAPDRTIFVSWTAKGESESGHATDLYVSASRDQGQTFGEAVKVNDDKKPAVHGMHSLTVAKDGLIYVAWLDERNVAPKPSADMKMKQGTSGHHMESNREVYIATSADGGRTFSANRRIATDVCPCCKTALAVADDGRVYLSWRQVLPGDFRHIAVASSTDRGQSFSHPKVVSDDQWILTGCPVSGPTMAVSSDSVLHVLWYSAGKSGETGVYSSLSKDGGNSFEARTFVATGETRGTPVLMSDSESLAAVWETAAGKIMTASLKSKAGGQQSQFVVADGTQPAAFETTTNVITVYAAKAGEHQAVWILWSNREALRADVRQ